MIKKRKFFSFIFPALLCLFNISCLNMDFVCENTSEKESVSHNGKLKAVIFDRGCGATVGFITAISIIPVNDSLNNEDAGNILFAENVYREFSNENGQTTYGRINFDVKWINDEELLVFYSESKQIYKRENFQNIKIKYELISK